MYDGKSSEKNPNQSSVENAVERDQIFSSLAPLALALSSTHLCSPNSPVPPPSPLRTPSVGPTPPPVAAAGVRRDAITVRRSFSERKGNVEVLLRALIGVAVWRTLPPPARRAAFTWASTGRTRRGSCRSGPTPLSHPHATPPTTSRPASRYRFTQADCERVGRVMTLTKTKLRSSLSDEHFEQSVWVAYNSPGIHEVDLQAFVERWRLDGHLSATMSGGGERAREVLDRKARERKHTFLAMAREGE